MAWIESHEALEKHPKVLQLGILMRWSLDETIGKLHRFWWWSLNYATIGDLRRINPLVPAANLGLVDEAAQRFIPAMIECCLVCRIGRTKRPWRIHDWFDYANRFLRDTKFKHHPDKYQQFKELYAHSCTCSDVMLSADSRLTVGGLSAVPTNQPTNQPKKCDSADADSLSRFQEFWQVYPERNGKKLEKGSTQSLFLKLSIQDQTLAVIAARNYAEALKQSGISARDPKRFLRDGKGQEFWRDWIEPGKPGQPTTAKKPSDPIPKAFQPLPCREGTFEPMPEGLRESIGKLRKAM